MLDFCYTRDVMLKFLDDHQPAAVVVIDHHKSAADDMSDTRSDRIIDMRKIYDAFGSRPSLDSVAAAMRGRKPGVILTYFDMHRSGAGMAWDFFHSGTPRPPLINHIEDRDLWRFALPYTREIQAALFSYPYDFVTWDRLMSMPIAELAIDGVAIERKHHKDVADLVRAGRREMMIGGYRVPVANLPYTLCSDACHMMCEGGEVFAACYWDTPEGRVFSLRSCEDGIDVSEIAKRYGGGGHRHAAGFKLPHGVDP
jgi:oligoribonuclease NrnB/cAMP/cGMP phosphodiesterase (DHH superfamily)